MRRALCRERLARRCRRTRAMALAQTSRPGEADLCRAGSPVPALAGKAGRRLSGAGQARRLPALGLPEVPDGAVVLFVDGLRFDLARELEALLGEDNGLSVGLEPGFTSVPSVTSSGKVWVSPACKLAEGAKGSGGRLRTDLPKGAYTADKLRKAMEAEVFAIVDTESPSFAYGKGWAEFPGDIDSDGHNKGLKLARAVRPTSTTWHDHTSPAECGLEGSLGGHRPRLAAPARRPCPRRNCRPS
jgi:hypothetical protein